MKAAQAEARGFAALWRLAKNVDDALLSRYSTAHERARRTRRWRDEDDNPAVRSLGRKTAIKSFDKAAELTRATHLWVEAGNVVQNLGNGMPGNEVDLPKGTRAFFGLGTRDVPRKLRPLGPFTFTTKCQGQSIAICATATTTWTSSICPIQARPDPTRMTARRSCSRAAPTVRLTSSSGVLPM